jgi:hypothetical protein
MTEDRIIGGFFVLIIGAVVALCIWAAVETNDTYKEFMRQCQQDHKEYECYAMWRSTVNHDHVQTVVVPVAQ